MLLRRKNRARGPVPSLRIDERIKTFLPPELSSFRPGKGFRRICFVPARSILETSQGTKGKSSGIRGRERGEKEGKVVYLFGTQVPRGARAGSFRMIMIFKLKISGRGLTRISAAAATFQRSVRSPEKLSINLCAPLYFSSSSAGDRRYLVLPAIRIGCLQVWGHALHAGHPVTRSPLENTKHHSSTSNTISITFAQRRSVQSVKRVVRHDRVCGAIW